MSAIEEQPQSATVDRPAGATRRGVLVGALLLPVPATVIASQARPHDAKPKATAAHETQHIRAYYAAARF